jgi:hypothetical protein
MSLVSMTNTEMSIFEEQYRVIEIESDHLAIRGTLSGEILRIANHDPDTPLSQEDYPPGTLIALTYPATATPN